jgi:hypothetical protein
LSDIFWFYSIYLFFIHFTFTSTEAYKQDIDEVIGFSVQQLNKPHHSSSPRFLYERLLNGYKQFEPTRGAQYILDLIVFDTTLNVSLHKRANVMRPLGLLESILMPYVTETGKISLVVAFTLEHSQQEIDDFFQTYEQHGLDVKEVADKLTLFVVYLGCGSACVGQMRAKEELSFARIKQTIKKLNGKKSSFQVNRIIEYRFNISLGANASLYYSDGYRQLFVVEQMSQKLSPDSLVLVASPCVEFQGDFLNRVRLNTIRQHQVFFPIVFSEYMPNIVYPARPFPDEIQINKNVGYFNVDSYEFASFYISDYFKVRYELLSRLRSTTKQGGLALLDTTTTNTSGLSTLAEHVLDLYELFATSESLHVLRGTDQSLKCRWRLNPNCLKSNRSSDELERCVSQNEKSMGTKAQLAQHLMKNFDAIFKKKKKKK